METHDAGGECKGEIQTRFAQAGVDLLSAISPTEPRNFPYYLAACIIVTALLMAMVFETDTECAPTYMSPHRCCCSVWVCFGGTTRANGPARKEDPVPNWRAGSLR